MAKHFIKGSTIESGSDGSCNVESVFNKTNVINGTNGRLLEIFTFVEDLGQNGDCKLMTDTEWKGIWTNCKERDGDKCYNAATNTTPEQITISHGCVFRWV